jgi:hypothetical protein
MTVAILRLLVCLFVALFLCLLTWIYSLGFNKVYQLDGGVIGYRLEQNAEGNIEERRIETRGEADRDAIDRDEIGQPGEAARRHSDDAYPNGSHAVAVHSVNSNAVVVSEADALMKGGEEKAGSKNPNREVLDGARLESNLSSLPSRGEEEKLSSLPSLPSLESSDADAYWVGKIFVFDDRLAVPLRENSNEPVIATCHSCGGV